MQFSPLHPSSHNSPPAACPQPAKGLPVHVLNHTPLSVHALWVCLVPPSYQLPTFGAMSVFPTSPVVCRSFGMEDVFLLTASPWLAQAMLHGLQEVEDKPAQWGRREAECSMAA